MIVARYTHRRRRRFAEVRNSPKKSAQCSAHGARWGPGASLAEAMCGSRPHPVNPKQVMCAGTTRAVMERADGVSQSRRSCPKRVHRDARPAFDFAPGFPSLGSRSHDESACDQRARWQRVSALDAGRKGRPRRPMMPWHRATSRHIRSFRSCRATILFI